MALLSLQRGLSLLLAAWVACVFADDAVSDVKSIPLRTHSLSQPYLDSDLQSRWFDFGGSTVIRADQYIRLTGNYPSEAGWLFSRVPLTATNWEVEFEFKIHGSGTLFGDGMAFWVTKSRVEEGPVFGMRDEFEGLGIFFDTYKNNRPGVVFPYVMAMVGDGKTKYDQGNDGKANELAGCSARGMRNPDFPTRAKVTYFQDKELTLDLMYKNEDEWTRCFSVPDIKLPSVSYLGFSAETGELSDSHDIISIDTKNLYSPSGQTGTGSTAKKDYNRNKYRGTPTPQESASGGWFWFFMKFIIFGLTITGAYVGFTIYRSRRRDRF